MDATTNSINWFEIPVLDLQRAKHFYQAAFDIKMDEMEMDDIQMAMFPSGTSGKVSGALVKSQWQKPSGDGVLIYLNANPSMEDILKRIEAEGMQILMPKTQISPEYGYMAMFIDTEGNKMALHSD